MRAAITDRRLEAIAGAPVVYTSLGTGTLPAQLVPSEWTIIVVCPNSSIDASGDFGYDIQGRIRLTVAGAYAMLRTASNGWTYTPGSTMSTYRWGVLRGYSDRFRWQSIGVDNESPIDWFDHPPRRPSSTEPRSRVAD